MLVKMGTQLVHYQKGDDPSHCSSDYHNLFSEHLGTHYTLKMQWSEML